MINTNVSPQRCRLSSENCAAVTCVPTQKCCRKNSVPFVFFLIVLNFRFTLCVCFPHMYICMSHVCLVPMEVADPLELELWMVVTHMSVLGFKPSSSSRVASALKWEPPFCPLILSTLSHACRPNTFAQHTRAEKRPGGSLKLEHSVWYYQCRTGSLSQKLRNELGALQLTEFQTLTKKWNIQRKEVGEKGE